MFGDKKLSEITENDIDNYYKEKEKHKHQEPNDRIEGKGDYMDIIRRGIEKTKPMKHGDKNE